ITGGPDLGLFEVNEAAEIISQAADPEANIIFGAVIDEKLEDEVRVTVIATGFDAVSQEEKEGAVVDLRSFTTDDLDIPAFLRKR
ncbi:MAG: hypothetical protein WBI48_06745, partial [Thermacetogeniaceae bacterium]